LLQNLVFRFLTQYGGYRNNPFSSLITIDVEYELVSFDCLLLLADLFVDLPYEKVDFCHVRRSF